MNLWNFGAIVQPQVGPTMPQNAHQNSLTGPVLQSIYDHAVRLKTTLMLLRQSDLMKNFAPLGESLPAIEDVLQMVIDQAAWPRGVTYPEVERRQMMPDTAWAVKLREIALARGNGMVVATEDSAECLKYVVELSKKTADTLLKYYEIGRDDRWNLMLLSPMKTAIALIDGFTDFESVRKRLKEMRSEIASLSGLCTALGLPEAASLEAAAAALKGS